MSDRKIGLFDLDQTLADYDGRMRSDLEKLRNPDEPSPLNLGFNLYSDEYPWIEERMELIKRQPGWWSGLDKNRLGFEILQIAEKIGFDNVVLTKGPRSKPVAWSEKVEWVNKHLGECFPIDIVGGQTHKGERYGLFLCDDYLPYVLGWLKHRKRGLAIVPAGVHNIDAEKKHENIIRYDGTNINEVEDALKAVFQRGSKQHWSESLLSLTKDRTV